MVAETDIREKADDELLLNPAAGTVQTVAEWQQKKAEIRKQIRRLLGDELPGHLHRCAHWPPFLDRHARCAACREEALVRTKEALLDDALVAASSLHPHSR